MQALAYIKRLAKHVFLIVVTPLGRPPTISSVGSSRKRRNTRGEAGGVRCPEKGFRLRVAARAFAGVGRHVRNQQEPLSALPGATHGQAQNTILARPEKTQKLHVSRRPDLPQDCATFWIFLGILKMVVRIRICIQLMFSFLVSWCRDVFGRLAIVWTRCNNCHFFFVFPVHADQVKALWSKFQSEVAEGLPPTVCSSTAAIAASLQLSERYAGPSYRVCQLHPLAADGGIETTNILGHECPLSSVGEQATTEHQHQHQQFLTSRSVEDKAGLIPSSNDGEEKQQVEARAKIATTQLQKPLGLVPQTITVVVDTVAPVAGFGFVPAR